MTLNITLLTKEHIYQSADHRLWDMDSLRLVTDTSNKTVSVGGRESHGILTYTGIGRWQQLDTSQWIVRWLTGRPQQSFDELVELIRMRGSSWLDDIGRARKAQPPHSFIVTAFVGGHPMAALISNFDHLRKAPSGKIMAELIVSNVSSISRPRVIVTGCLNPVVKRQQRRMLERLARDHGDNSGRIRRAMQQLNRRAAQVAGDKCPISKDCFVQSFSRYGTGYYTGAEPGVHLRRVFEGMDVGTSMQNAIEALFPRGAVRLVGGTSVSTGKIQPTRFRGRRIAISAPTTEYFNAATPLPVL